jgi:hypothetical protein
MESPDGLERNEKVVGGAQPSLFSDREQGGSVPTEIFILLQAKMTTSRLSANSLVLYYGDPVRTFGEADKDGGVYPEARTTRSVQVSSANATVGNARAMACVNIRSASCATTGIECTVPVRKCTLHQRLRY